MLVSSQREASIHAYRFHIDNSVVSIAIWCEALNGLQIASVRIEIVRLAQEYRNATCRQSNKY